MPTGFELLKNAVILDTEATGLTRGSGIHELAIFDLDKMQVTEYLLNPQLVAVAAKTAQEKTRLASSAKDIHTIVKGINTWKELITAQTNLETGHKHNSWEETLNTLKHQNRFLYDAIQKNTHPRS